MVLNTGSSDASDWEIQTDQSYASAMSTHRSL